MHTGLRECTYFEQQKFEMKYKYIFTLCESSSIITYCILVLVFIFANGTISEFESSPYGSVICINGLWYTIPSTGDFNDGSTNNLEPLLTTNHFECQIPFCVDVVIGLTGNDKENIFFFDKIF